MHIGHGKKLTAIGLTALLALVGGGVAVGWFASGGSGTGSAVVGSPGPSDLHVVGHDPEAALLPGDDPQPFVFDVHNTGSASEHVGTVDITVAAAPVTGYALEDGTPITGCLASWFTVTSSVTVDTTVAAGAWDDGVSGASIAMSESGTDQSACEGHTVDVAFTVGLS